MDDDRPLSFTTVFQNHQFQAFLVSRIFIHMYVIFFKLRFFSYDRQSLGGGLKALADKNISFF